MLDLQSVTDVVSHRFVSNHDSSNGIVQIIPKPIAKNIHSAANINKDVLDMVIMKERMDRLLGKETLVVDGTGRYIAVY